MEGVRLYEKEKIIVFFSAFSIIIAAVAFYLYSFLKPFPLIDRDKSFRLGQVNYAGQEISECIDQNALIDLLCEYQKKRSPQNKNYFPKANWDMEVLLEIGVVNGNQNWCFIFERDGDALCYNTRDVHDMWEIIEGEQLLRELIRMFDKLNIS